MKTPGKKVASWALQMTHLRAARSFLEACESEGIRALPVKGIVSGRTLYEDAAERPLSDVDVRVIPRDVRRVEAMCRRRGWPVVQRMRSYTNVVAQVDDVLVDVEGHVGPPGVCDLSVEAMLGRATWSEALGFRCRWPDFTDHAVLLVVNAFKDKIVGAFEHSVRDLDQLPTRTEFDPTRVARALEDAGVATLGRVLAGWMADVRGSQGWREVHDALPERRPRYTRWMRRAIDEAPDALSTRVLSRAASDRMLNRARALTWMALWRAEVAASQLGKTPYRRGHVPPWGPGARK